MEHLLRELSRDHTLVRYDERGCGLSDWDVRAVVRGLGARPRDGRRRRAASSAFRCSASRRARRSRSPTRCAIRSASAHLILHGGYARGRLKRGATPAAARRGGDDDQARRARLGPGEPGVPPVLHDAVHSRRHARAAPAGSTSSSASRRRRANAARFMRVFNEIDVDGAAAAGRVPDARAARDARRARAVRGRPADRERAFPARASCRSRADNHLLLEHEPAWQRWVEEVRAFLPARRRAAPRFAALTPRERELVELIAQGRDNAQIAAQLGSQREDGAQPHHQHLRQARGREPRAGDRAGARGRLRLASRLTTRIFAFGTPVPRFPPV